MDILKNESNGIGIGFERVKKRKCPDIVISRGDRAVRLGLFDSERHAKAFLVVLQAFIGLRKGDDMKIVDEIFGGSDHANLDVP